MREKGKERKKETEGALYSALERPTRRTSTFLSAPIIYILLYIYYVLHKQ